jgi:hypothetical protein
MENNTDDISLNDIKIKTKIEKYKKERKEIMDKLFKILNIQTENGTRFFYIDEITEEKEKEILELRNDIKRYFLVNKWVTFKNTIKIEKIHMSLIRNLLKHENIKYKLGDKMIEGVKKKKMILIDTQNDI